MSVRITKEILEFKCDMIRRETGLNVGISYAYGTQRIVLKGVYEKGCTGEKNLSYSGTKKEIGNALDAVYNIILQMKYAGDQYRLDDGKES